MRFLKIAAVMTMVGAASVLAHSQRLGVPAASMTYDDFVKLEPMHRADRFRSMSPEEKAAIKRTHAQLWLGANRKTLSAAQIAAVEEAIAFITPEVYLNPEDPELGRRQDALRRKLSCVVGPENGTAAFVVVHQSPSQRVDQPAWEVVVDRWLAWFTDCVIR